MMRKLFDKNFTPLPQIFGGGELKYVFSSQFFCFSPNVDKGFVFFNINSKGTKELQKFSSKLLNNFSSNYGGLKILSSHFIMKFQSCNGIFFSKKSIIQSINILLKFQTVSSDGTLSKKIKTD